jgi:beta-lactamase superfamily II metal-dependent hydrolase
MATTKTTVSVRMYNMGFGDAFVVTVRRGRKQWRMLVDCGVHSAGRARPLEEAVDAIIADLAADSPGGTPHLDVVVATHHHADHIAGFALDAWEQVAVDEVWVPFVEDEKDEDVKALRKKQRATANRLRALVERRGLKPDEPDSWPDTLGRAYLLAMNSSGNDRATDRLLHRNRLGFATKPTIRFLPSKTPSENRIDVGIADTTVHVLGPPRDPALLKRMEPPKKAGWLLLSADDDSNDEDRGVRTLFRDEFVLKAEEMADHVELSDIGASLRLEDLDNDAGLLAAAAVLEGAVNNTSIFFVLEVGDLRLAFPGDSQHGGWEHVLDDPESAELMRRIDFYKIGHHGSHNGTSKRYIEEGLKDSVYAMLPFRTVKQWDSIPKEELLEALHDRGHHVIRADAPKAVRGKVKVKDDLWTEVAFTA